MKIRNKATRYKINADLILMTGIALIMIFSLIIMYSAGNKNMDLMHKQIYRIIISFITMMIVAQINPNKYLYWALPIYVFGILCLLSVEFFGEINKGAKRWLNIGGLKFQPSEIMKIIFPIFISYYISKFNIPITRKEFFLGIIIISIPTILISRQPDLGTSILVASSGLFVLFIAGLHWGIITFCILSLIPATYLMWNFIMHDYQRKRVLTLFNQEEDPLGSSYHIIQSKIAIGSGGLFGKGWLKGTQSQLDFLPERHTDFIFAVIGEEFGLIGALALLACYLLIIVRGLFIANNAANNFSKLLAASITLTFFVYIFVNIAMVSGIIPVVGVPLPLVSYGGTSMITLMVGFGILISIKANSKRGFND